jgi:hypothetical protein
MNKKYRKITFLIILLLLVLLSCVPNKSVDTPFPSTKPPTVLLTPTPVVLKVEDVLDNKELWLGKRVRLRGKLGLALSKTLQLCDPPTCDCNATTLDVNLFPESGGELLPENDGIDYVELDFGPTHLCKGDECAILCAPIHPQSAEYFEFLGNLFVRNDNGQPISIKLTDIDIHASRQLVDGKWESIPTGEFTVSISTDGAGFYLDDE